MARPIQLLRDGLICLGILAAALVLCLLLQQVHPSQSLVSLILVLAVFLISLTTRGYLWGVTASLICVLMDNYVFSFPYLAFDFLETENLVSAVVLLVVSVITSTLLTKLKQQEKLNTETELEKMRSNLLRAISHDLRTPLTTIYGSCSVLLDENSHISQDRQRALLRDMQTDCDDLIRMVENLLSVTRVNGESVAIVKTPTVLEELVDSVVLRFHKRHPGQAVRISIPEDFISIPMDAMLLEQVLVNLLDNAVYHATGMTQLELRVTVRGQDALFEVLDDGCGLSKDRLEHLFSGQICSRDKPADAARHGIGIGLSVCAAIIKAHGSEIQGENRKSGGAVFRFSLPMEECDHEQ